MLGDWGSGKSNTAVHVPALRQVVFAGKVLSWALPAARRHSPTPRTSFALVELRSLATRAHLEGKSISKDRTIKQGVKSYGWDSAAGHVSALRTHRRDTTFVLSCCCVVSRVVVQGDSAVAMQDQCCPPCLAASFSQTCQGVSSGRGLRAQQSNSVQHRTTAISFDYCRLPTNKSR